jgi:hypothetical protein
MSARREIPARTFNLSLGIRAISTESIRTGSAATSRVQPVPQGKIWACSRMDERLSKRNHGSVLPLSRGTLYALTRLDDSTFDEFRNISPGTAE